MNTAFSYLPNWPADEGNTLVLSLRLDKQFTFRHYSGFRQPKDDSGVSEPFFLKPEQAILQIENFLGQRHGGSLLVSGYRGTGKSSIVHCALSEYFPATDKPSRMLKVELNLSTINRTLDVLMLLVAQLETTIRAWLDAVKTAAEVTAKANGASEEEQKAAGAAAALKWNWQAELRKIHSHFAVRTTVTQSKPRGLPIRDLSAKETSPQDAEHSFDQSVALGQQALEAFLQTLKESLRDLLPNKKEDHENKALFKIVIIYDELDKLIPAGSLVEAAGGALPLKEKARRMEQMQKIVADLKFLFTESRCHHIFIAGKDADESWQEDQHKGEGIFESVFAYNVYVRSLFSVKFPEKDDKAKAVDGALTAIGISPHSISANTGRVVLRMLDGKVLKRLQHGGAGCAADCALTEIETRALRIFIHFLTYKGRGIPRKLLREFYSFVRNHVDSDVSGSEGRGQNAGETAKEKNGECGSSSNADLGQDAAETTDKDEPARRYCFYIQLHELQRMTFYAEIVEHFDEHFGEFRLLDDKGRVSLFHIVDYVLKFYETGFSKQSIESANFMTTREELFPGQRLVADVIDFLDGRLFVSKDRRSPEYRLLPTVAHDLTKLFLRHGPEQMELRHTIGEFDAELKQLEPRITDLTEGGDSRRRNSIISLIRLGRVYEHLGRYLDARITYGTAMRSLRHDIEAYSRNSKRYSDPNATERRDFSDSFLATYVGYAINVLQRMGHLHDMVNEHRAALQFYAEAIEMHRRVSDLDTCQANQFPYELFTNTEMSLERTLGTESAVRKHLYYTDVKPAFQEGLQRFCIEGEPEGVVHSYNHAAISAEKTWARQAANGYLLSALNYQHAVNDEYGMIDQLAFIAQVMIRRREMRPAALWLLLAVRQCADLFTAAHPRFEEGVPYAAWRWSTPSAQTHSIAKLLVGLGDIYFATDGLAFVPTGTERERRDEAFWVTLGTAIPRLIAETRTFVYCYEHARLLLESCGDRCGIIDVRMRQLELYVESLDVRIRKGDHAIKGTHLFRAPAPSSDEKKQQEQQEQLEKELEQLEKQPEQLKKELEQLEQQLEQMAKQMELLTKQQEQEQLEKELEQLKRQVEQLKKQLKKQEQLRSVAKDAYPVLRTWVAFWSDAKASLFELLSTKPALMREGTRPWGNVKARRQMGNLMRLIGEVLSNMALSGRLLETQKEKENGAGSTAPPALAPASPAGTQKEKETGAGSTGEKKRAPSMRGLMASYASMISKGSTGMESELSLYTTLIAAERMFPEKSERLQHMLKAEFEEIEFTRIQRKKRPTEADLNEKQKREIKAHVRESTNPLAAAADIGDVFAYISDRWDHIASRTEMNDITVEVGGQSLLWKAIDEAEAQKADPEAKPPKERKNLLLGQELLACLIKDDEEELKKKLEEELKTLKALATDLRLLALAEKALLTGHLNYRECLPSAGHAHLCLALGKCYSRMLYIGINDENQGKFDLELLKACYRKLHLHTKRFLTLCISMVEQEPDPRPFARQVASEASFILGDLMFTWWCSCWQEDGKPNQENSPDYLPLLAPDFKIDPKSAAEAKGAADSSAEVDVDETDVKRQVMTYYQNGLRYVMQELDEHQSRYPLPHSVQYAYRNLLDSDTQFEIARAVHKRHTLAESISQRADASRRDDGKAGQSSSPRYEARSRVDLLRVFDDIGQAIKRANNPFLARKPWVNALLPVLQMVNAVRTDRGPLKTEQGAIRWMPMSELPDEHTILLFPNRRLPNEGNSPAQSASAPG